MLPTKIVESVRLADGTEFALLHRGDEWLVRVGAEVLMSSRIHDSEEALAAEALARVEHRGAILVGGLGLGFTLRATLDRVGPQARVTVAELVPALVQWNREYVGALAGHPLSDPRTEVAVGDVVTLIQRSRAVFDAILLDVDNGPHALSQPQNSRLYDTAGLRRCRAALRPGGVLAVWSAGESERFERSLQQAGFSVEKLRVPARKGAGARHFLYLGKNRS